MYPDRMNRSNNLKEIRQTNTAERGVLFSCQEQIIYFLNKTSFPPDFLHQLARLFLSVQQSMNKQVGSIQELKCTDQNGERSICCTERKSNQAGPQKEHTFSSSICCCTVIRIMMALTKDKKTFALITYGSQNI